MKILHTSDWHLGQRLLQQDRNEEFALALDWLLETIEEQAVDVLLVSGDVFDIGNPPNQSRKLYYTFLRRLLATQCRHIVITGGNHDSPAMLDAPAELLQSFNIHVIGAATEDIADELLLLCDAEGEVELVVAAVPFLRDRDLRISRVGEDQQERQARLQQGLQDHYQQLADLAKPYAQRGVPCIAMGHLYAKGAVATDKQDNIYVGNRENMEAGQFPEIFDYVALGHIHRAQAVEGNERVRYCGSLVPLSFSETKDEKQVLLLEWEGKAISKLECIAVPTFRRLKTIQGNLPKVQAALDRFVAKGERTLRPWVELIVETDEFVPQLDQQLRDYCKEMPLQLVKIRMLRPYETLRVDLADTPDLESLEVIDVFRRKCAAQGAIDESALVQLETTFLELQDWMNEQEA